MNKADLDLPFLVNLEFGNVGFWGEAKENHGVGTQRKTSQSKGENQEQTYPHTVYGVDARNWTQATLVGHECSHQCATLAPMLI